MPHADGSTRPDHAIRVRAARALLCVALSAVAVPSCQHYDAGSAPDDAQASNARVVTVSESAPTQRLST